MGRQSIHVEPFGKEGEKAMHRQLIDHGTDKRSNWVRSMYVCVCVVQVIITGGVKIVLYSKGAVNKTTCTQDPSSPSFKFIYIYIYNIECGVGLIQNHLFATLSFMPHARQSSGDCQKKRLHEKIYKFENREQ